jgi:glycosyltransferase involved in cell wall biosynthesis
MEGLRERGHEVHAALLLAGTTGCHPYLESLAGAGVIIHEIRNRNRDYLRERAAIVELCRSTRPGVAHTHGYRADVVAASGARRLGVPTVTTVHGYIGGSWHSRLYEKIQTRAFRDFDGVAAVSQPLFEMLLRKGVPISRLCFIQNAYAGTFQLTPRADARRKLGIENGAFQVGWVGRLSREKGADVLLDALPPLADPAVEINFVGDGPERTRLEDSPAGRATANRVRWLGSQPAAEKLFGAFDAFVLSSRTEGTPMVLFEAMAAGVPIIATRVGGVPDVVDESCALLIPPQDPHALAAAIRAVREQPGAAVDRAARARARLTSRFSRPEWIRRYETLYQKSARR